MSLDRKLLAAHSDGDLSTLIDLYTKASAESETEVARGFYLTHAYIFALEVGDARADALAEHLRGQGRL